MIFFQSTPCLSVQSRTLHGMTTATLSSSTHSPSLKAITSDCFASISLVAAHSSGKPLGGITPSYNQSLAFAFAGFQFAVGTSLNKQCLEKFTITGSASELTPFRSYLLSLPPLLVCSFIEFAFDHRALSLIPLFFTHLPDVEGWNEFADSVTSDLKTVIQSVPKPTLSKIFSQTSSYQRSLDTFARFSFDTTITPVAHSIYHRLLSICSTAIALNPELYLNAASAVFELMKDINLSEDLAEDDCTFPPQIDGFGSRIAEITPNPLVLVSYIHFEKIRSILLSFNSSDTEDLNFPEAFSFIHTHYRSAVNLTESQFLSWGCLVCNCALDRVVFAA